MTTRQASRHSEETMTVAAVQATPTFLDLDATVQQVITRTEEAATNGADLVVFPEAFVPGYPDWVWRTTPWSGPSSSLYERLVRNAVTVPGAATDEMADVARRTGTNMVVGIDERDPDGSTVYCSLLYIDADGEIAGVHRKLMPTGGERLVWGQGDGSGLVTMDTAGGRVGGLICWENYMPLARAAMYAMGVEIWVAPTWDNSDVWVPTLRHIAKEGRCYVIGTNSVLRGSDVPVEFGAADIYGGDDDWMSRGNTCIIDPHGNISAGPLSEETGILYAEIDRGDVARSRLQFDACGHYARHDIFQLTVDAKPTPPVTMRGAVVEGSETDVASTDA